ncbi:molybdate ABC transporter substrate-binding protein [Devosia sp.]|uniref:molybdate ABC transporter substrate-binding protein n=1 Tax=Devosia sp. TaxID=1871048 RepID=UPI001AC91FBE|nr:molybdate ABC transporter substrate-binding protein [Devosia sp.]MBN9307881.1 molybdate ABC transporter substrate-binding protein [Devosia sp.]
MRRTFLLPGLALAALMTVSAPAAEISAAVAANFTKPAEELGKTFTARTGDTVAFSFGATGQLYTQLSQGAPFEVFLAADDKRPALAVQEGFGVAGTVFTYAVGKVVLYSPNIDVTDGAAVLKANAFRHLAVADPRTAPYGAAGMQVLDRLGLTETVTARIVTGENISQALQFIESGNAELGFVALSQVVDKPATQVWRVPAEDYAPIRQDAVLTTAGAGDPAARAFLQFLQGDEGRAIIEKYGYEVK